MEVFDGATSLGVYSGTSIPGPFTSTDPSGELTFTFTSNGSGTQSGWVADITCSILCNLMILETAFPIGADACNLDYNTLTTNALASPAPSTVYSETFDNAGFPVGWNRFNGAASADWIISNSNNAGGVAREAMLDWTSGGDISNWILSSPGINITGYSNLELTFKQDLWQFGTDFTLFVETSLDGTNWTTQYSRPNPPDFIETRNIDISSLDGNTTLYFRFRFTGDSFDLFRWSLDDIIISGDSAPIPPQITWTPSTGLFTDNTLSTAYTGGFLETVYAAPNGTETYTATDQNSCTDNITVSKNGKIWNGSQSTDWYDNDNWTPTGIPTNQNCVIIPDVATTSNRSPSVVGSLPTPPLPGFARTLKVEANGYLEIQPNANLMVTDNIYIEDSATPNGKIIIRDDGNLIQINNTPSTANVGNIQMQRTVNSLAPQDYVYWSSPVANFAVTAVSPGSNLRYSWLPTVSTNGVGYYGDWQATTEVMQAAKGYIIRGVSGTSPEGTSATNIVEFTGIARKGIINRNITHGGYNGADYPGAGSTMATSLDDNWNLVGNPYPSSISADKFIARNALMIVDDTDPAIAGTVYLWRHLSAPSTIGDPFYGDFVYNYNPNDYIAYNSTGP